MNKKQSELSGILAEIYTQTKQYQDIIIRSLDGEELDRMHKEKLEYIRIFLRNKLASAEKFGHPDPGMAEKLRRRIKIFEEMGD